MLDNGCVQVVSEYMATEGPPAMKSEAKGAACHKVGLHLARIVSYQPNPSTVPRLNALFEIACHTHVGAAR
jgi:hypothetical protein